MNKPSPITLAEASQIKRQANGMLAPEVYQEIAATAANAPGERFLEIGTAHGAATIALALGAKRAGKAVHVQTVDRLAGGSRARYGDRSANEEIVRKNFETFGVSDDISLFIGSSQAFHESQPQADYGLLMLDADGKIDRDLDLFYKHLAPGAPIIIDDCDDFIKVALRSPSVAKIDMKHKLTYSLTELYCEKGYLSKTKTVRGTAFCRKSQPAENKVDFLLPALDVYRTLIHATGKIEPVWITALKSNDRLYKALSPIAANKVVRRLRGRP